MLKYYYILLKLILVWVFEMPSAILLIKAFSSLHQFFISIFHSFSIVFIILNYNAILLLTFSIFQFTPSILYKLTKY